MPELQPRAGAYIGKTADGRYTWYYDRVVLDANKNNTFYRFFYGSLGLVSVQDGGALDSATKEQADSLLS